MWRIEILKVLSPPVETATGPVWVLNVLQQPKVVSSQENSAFKGYLLILKTVCLGGEKPFNLKGAAALRVEGWGREGWGW